ncbi:MAG: DMT family transporter [Chloroflexota bacterium]
MQRAQLYPMIQALLAAVLFGASAPLAKLLLGEVEPISLAAFLYLGSGIGVLLFKGIRHSGTPEAESEAQIKRSDWGWLAGSVFAGGVAAPIVLLFSLRSTPAATASLLLNFEGVATSLIAALFFKESLNRTAVWAILCVTTASILLSWDVSGQWGLSLGALGILSACVLWGVDNNLTRNISAKDPLSIVLVKGLGAGSFSLLLTLLLGNSLPRLTIMLGAMLLGSISYGLSIVLFIRAMRGLGAARTSALFGIAPLAGVLLSFLLFRETPNTLFIIALPLMIVAALLLFREKHNHKHVHEAVTHEHRHRHDDGHHNHDHPEMMSRSLTHSHVHTHEPIEHEHPHVPDIHHRHIHQSE